LLTPSLLLLQALAGAQAATSQAELALHKQQQFSTAAVRAAAEQLAALQGGALTADFSGLIEDVAKAQSTAARCEVERVTAVKR
jgi:hypothetical protein